MSIYRMCLSLLLALLLCGTLLLSNCGLLSDEELAALDDFFETLIEPPEKEPLTGQNAFLYLDRDNSRLPVQDRAALLGALRTAETPGGEVEEPGNDVVDLLQKNIRGRQSIKTDRFAMDPDDVYPPPPEGEMSDRLFLDVSKLQSEFLIPHLEAIPVKNQGERGTCAAFTGIGHVEYAVLDKNPALASVDLSEQRFYWMSKPECHSNGCTLFEEGSWYATGMEASVVSSSYDIPREQDCQYRESLGPNDVQIPQDSTCEDGAVKVVSLKYVQEAAEIVSVLENDGLPVPYASKLSDNWRYTDGLITHAGSDYSSTIDKHSGGHAYLIVGYRKLPNMQDEGGMCFIIKNSWGTGWGVNGYSCMTLEWMENWGKNYLEQPIVMDVLINEELLQADDTSPDPVPDYFNPDTYDDETVDWDDYEDGDEDDIPDPDPEPAPAPEPRPQPYIPDWQVSAIKGPDDFFYRVEIADDPEAGALHVKGYIRNRTIPSGILTLEKAGDALYYDGDRVGDYSNDHLVICTGPYDVLCSLRLNKDDNELYIEFVNPEFRRIQADELVDGEWETLLGGDDGALGLEFFNADNLGERLLYRYILIRVTDTKGTKTEAMRLTLDGLDVKLMGETIGSLTPGKMGLCTGSHAANCKLYKGRHGLTIFPRARPKL
jgi:hypothetical protein